MPWESTGGGLEVESSSDDDEFLRNLKNKPVAISKPKHKPEPKPEPKPVPKPVLKPEPKPEPKLEPKPEPKPAFRTINKPEIIPEAKPVLMRSKMVALFTFNKSEQSCMILTQIVIMILN